MATDEVRKDLRAAVAARQDLGAEYEPEIIDGFLERLDQRAAARYGQQGHPLPAPLPPDGKKDTDGGGLALAIVSVVAGIPITAIAANLEGTFAMVICWGGLVGINLARAAARFTNR
ncbi:hypothetical protein [Kribbella sp. NPDC051770]|uniref:hypothetical protein n=1 Tax=Kribbella sp. NPDC051770 TaxID=3155413 RepID=UPI00344A7C1B